MSAEAISSPPAPVIIISQCDWSLSWVFVHELSDFLAGKGHLVIYLNPFPKRFPRLREWRRMAARLWGGSGRKGLASHGIPAGMRIITPLTFPDRNRFFTFLNRTLLLPFLKRRITAMLPGHSHPWGFVFLPFATPVALAKSLTFSRLVYAMREGYDEDRALDRIGRDESWLFANSGLLISSGAVLEEKCRGHGVPVWNIPGMVDFAKFFRPVCNESKPEPRCGFIGHLNSRVDGGILEAIGRRFPLRVVGHVSVPVPFAKRIELIGLVPHDRIPRLLEELDVVVIPYRRDGFNRCIFPYKIFEIFAQGIPVVSTPLPSLEKLSGLIYFACSPEEFLEKIALASRESPDLKLRRQKIAREYDKSAILGRLRERLLEESRGGNEAL